jgi:hypothetical protein
MHGFIVSWAKQMARSNYSAGEKEGMSIMKIRLGRIVYRENNPMRNPEREIIS